MPSGCQVFLGGSSTIKYAKKVVLKKINSKNIIFNINIKKILETYLNCILNSWSTSLSLL
jgi:hypothetical protein